MFPVGKKRETNENALPAYVQVFEKNGAPGGDRTHDPLLRRQNKDIEYQYVRCLFILFYTLFPDISYLFLFDFMLT